MMFALPRGGITKILRSTALVIALVFMSLSANAAFIGVLPATFWRY